VTSGMGGEVHTHLAAGTRYLVTLRLDL
jgi:hypothetical protein